MEFYDNVNDGGFYLCDKCDVARLGEFEYNNYIQFQYHYCELCWNYLHIKKGVCGKCNSKMTNRSDRPTETVVCGCGNQVLLEMESW